MQLNQEITLTLPDGTVRTGTIKKIHPPRHERFYVVEFPTGTFGLYESEIRANQSKQRIDGVKAIIGDKFCTLPKRMWAMGILRGLYSVHNHELEPITFTEMNYLIDYICGNKE